MRHLPVQVWLGAREALRPSNALLLGVLALCTFTMVLPTNVSTTLSNPQIATYLGVGQADLRIDVRTGVQDLATVEKGVDSDPRITRHTTVLRRSYKMSTSSGGWEPVAPKNWEAYWFMPIAWTPGYFSFRSRAKALAWSGEWASA